MKGPWALRRIDWMEGPHHRGTERHRDSQRKAEEEEIEGRTTLLLLFSVPLCVSLCLCGAFTVANRKNPPVLTLVEGHSAFILPPSSFAASSLDLHTAKQL